ncbi:putative RDD family membrane protein YckC [Paucimonas lemoignei]|uniref:Putative RDD family membrane protein YckC n=1 Tax=Paucimonas lemoignei TaxID=29443 RepID=A0A4R3HTL8_PAULE|nr:RDD family protein [Paucimonas lemoignei]TCS36034.1 putative RDD family membrane protein YckC [Paucimonas lemoignei]
MSHANPYLPPDAVLRVEEDTSAIELATRWQRFWAGILDAIIGFVCGAPFLFAFGLFDYSRRGQTPPLMLTLALTAVAFVIFILVHGYFLKRNGQTIGKKVMGIKIVDLNDNTADFWKIVLRRYLPISAVSVIPAVGQILPLIDVLFIFTAERRCVHDLIAGTKVIKAKSD